MKVTLGGERLGSGKKMDVAMRNYGRSTHNLTRSWKSTMAPGVLTPFLKILALNADTFDISLDSIMRTIPTKAPLFGSFKLQLDVFQVPIRLYQGILHNNPINIGLKMSQVKLPVMGIPGNTIVLNKDPYNSHVATNALLKYLGISGTMVYTGSSPVVGYYRKFQCVPMLAYYDIFKNYYANKQETNAYVITGETEDSIDKGGIWEGFIRQTNGRKIYYQTGYFQTLQCDLVPIETPAAGAVDNEYNGFKVTYEGEVTTEDIYVSGDGFGNGTLASKTEDGVFNTTVTYNKRKSINTLTGEPTERITETIIEAEYTGEENSTISAYCTIRTITPKIKLQSFPLENIDKMREKILNKSVLGSAMMIAATNSDTDFLPYNVLTKYNNNDVPMNAYAMNGLLVKTYQSDLFNNWIQTEWIDGDNGIAAVTAIDTSEGKFTLDQLNISQKIYNMLNRIAASGGTYQDWQKAVYTDNVVMHAETPIWCGGMSSEIVFEEVISTANTEDEALGGLAGKGRLAGKNGGKMHIRVHEPSYIIGIVSITPRVDYTQGNDWDMTEIESVDDLHKPELDGIGFQDLMVEQMAWWDAHTSDGTNMTRNAVGKVPAWINYMTAVDKAYGDFASSNGKNFMVLGRNYTWKESDDTVQDLTTYIDPEKFNYAFAYTELNAQNFWCQIVTKVQSRRKMSAKIIPNL